MSKKSIARRRNDTFNRNKEGSSERQLFDPRSDNPIGFNKQSSKPKEILKEQPEITREVHTKQPTRKLWNIESDKVIEPKEKKKVIKETDFKKEEQRKRLKVLISSIKSIENKLEELTIKSQSLFCFQNDVENHLPNRRNIDKVIDTPTLVEQDLIDTENIWKQKIQLHLSLGEKYLEILNCDLDYAEKKGLETLCWKRAIYSLVDQFRKALKKSSSLTTNKSSLILLEEDEKEKEEELFVPIINPSGGMTLIKKPQENQLLIKQTKIILNLFLHYLDLSDSFYQRVTNFLKSVDDENDEEMENYLKQWRRTKKYKWYSCIPLRGDIARYRLSYTPDYPLDYAWDKKLDTFIEAWKRYFLGIWLMPAKGNLYFNLSLVLQQLKNSPGNDFQKLYLSTRSLMVRRNGFLNARESMLVLFEGNRRWIQNNVELTITKSKRSSKKPIAIDKNLIIPALFVRLHGMLFTKIGLDEFSRIKRLYFDSLFQTNIVNDTFDTITKSKLNDTLLSESHLFWLQTIILCLSSLYTYDYSNSKLTKLISMNSTKLFYSNQQQNDEYQNLLQEIDQSILFTYGIDLTCQISIELFQRYLDPSLSSPNIPILPKLPQVSLNYKDNKSFLFNQEKEKEINNNNYDDNDENAWLIYIEILLHWIVLNGICIRSKDQISLWESLIGDIGHDFISSHQEENQSKISNAFWPLLLSFLNKLLSELPQEDKYDMVNKHFMDDTVPIQHETFSAEECAFANHILSILGQYPDLPEENYLRGLGWVDEIHGRFIKLEFMPQQQKDKLSIVMRRKMKILDYGFTLVKHLEDILYYDPVEEIFTISKSVEERAKLFEQNKQSNKPYENTNQSLYDEEQQPVTIAEMDDDVLLSSETEYFDEGDDMMTQLKKRREQLQSIVASAEQEERFGYRRLPARAKEREARLNYLRQCIIPGKTILVLDTNCFIGHIDHVKKLLESKKWSIIVPLVVVTELDGLRTNPHRLGLVAQQGIELLQNTLSVKSNKQLLRIQTSHNNFMNDISIRSEQFVFGETDKNLDDLVLSSCLWWISQQSPKDENDKTVPVCLVTGDRNLSVKARARDVEVIPVSAIIQLTPK